MLPALQSKIMDDGQLTKHRGYIAIKAQALMGRYFQLPQDELVKRDILLGWMDCLQDYTRDEIDTACRQYLIEYPRTRPHEGLIVQMLLKNRKRIIDAAPKVQIEAPPRKNPDAEARKRLSEELLGGIKRM